MQDRMGSRGRWVLVAALAGLFLVVSVGPVAAQANTPVVDDPPPPQGFARIDNVFKAAVSGMEGFLFYRLGQHDRTYVQLDPKIIYARERGGDGPFIAVGAVPDGEPGELTLDDVRLLAVQGELTEGQLIDGDVRNFRWGRQGDRPVEYVVRKLSKPDMAPAEYGDKLILDPQEKNYQLISPVRGAPTGEIVSQATVEEWNRRGYLVQGGGSPGYLLTERVGGIPVVVAWLAAGAVFFTLYMQFFNLRGVRHAINVIRGKYDNPAESGEVTHFQALASALSATVGLGNIAGVTIAMTIGGPGAFFWMLVCGVLGMSSKFAECTLGVKYRQVSPDGTVLGGPMRYLRHGLAEIRLAPLGIVLSIAFTIMCIFASFGGGNMLQANQAGSAMLQMFQQQRLDQLQNVNERIAAAAEAENLELMTSLQVEKNAVQTQLNRFEAWFKPAYGGILAVLVGVVIIGGIKRIGAAAEKIVPAMCLLYTAACFYIIVKHIHRVPEVVGQVFTEAWTGTAMGGGILGVLVVGVQRAAFSNEAGAGSAAIAHSAARTEEPIREGCVALLEPFIDTVIVCSMTALVILITGAWDHPNWVHEQNLKGAALTSRAFKEEIDWFPILLSISVTLFAYSTIISWSYYGERAWAFLLGSRTTFLYKVLSVIAVFVGSVVNLGSVLDFSDMMILGMAFPNILGVVLLSPKIKRDLDRYWKRYLAGEFPTYK